MCDPPDRALQGFLRGLANTRMPERAGRHMAKPASEQTVVERWNSERALQKQIPQIHQQSRANTNPDSSKGIVGVNDHGARLSRFTDCSRCLIAFLYFGALY